MLLRRTRGARSSCATYVPSPTRRAIRCDSGAQHAWSASARRHDGRASPRPDTSRIRRQRRGEGRRAWRFSMEEPVIPSPSAPLRAGCREGPGCAGGSARCRHCSEPPAPPRSLAAACPERSRRARDDVLLMVLTSHPNWPHVQSQYPMILADVRRQHADQNVIRPRTPGSRTLRGAAAFRREARTHLRPGGPRRGPGQRRRRLRHHRRAQTGDLRCRTHPRRDQHPSSHHDAGVDGAPRPEQGHGRLLRRHRLQRLDPRRVPPDPARLPRQRAPRRHRLVDSANGAVAASGIQCGC